jgi:hypothetical protein
MSAFGSPVVGADPAPVDVSMIEGSGAIGDIPLRLEAPAHSSVVCNYSDAKKIFLGGELVWWLPRNVNCRRIGDAEIDRSAI